MCAPTRYHLKILRCRFKAKTIMSWWKICTRRTLLISPVKNFWRCITLWLLGSMVSLRCISREYWSILLLRLSKLLVIILNKLVICVLEKWEKIKNFTVVLVGKRSSVFWELAVFVVFGGNIIRRLKGSLYPYQLSFPW